MILGRTEKLTQWTDTNREIFKWKNYTFSTIATKQGPKESKIIINNFIWVSSN